MKNSGGEKQKLILLFATCSIFSIMFSVILTRQPNVLIRSNHFSRWYATNKLVTEHRSIYDPQNGKEIVALNSIPVDPIEGSFFYPAHLMIFLLPTAYLEYPLSHFLWIITIQLFLVIALFIIYKEINWPESVIQFTVIVFLSILFIPNLQNTIWGQYNTIGVITLALVYITLRHERYFLSGLLCIGFTFKPQNYLLLLFFLLLWALLKRKRWNFLLGFTISCFAFWGFAEIFEPNWVISFFHGIRKYNAYLQPHAVLDYRYFWHALLIILFVGLFIWFFIKNYKNDANTGSFIGCLLLSLSIWWIIVPVVGMMYLVALPIVIFMLFPLLTIQFPKFYKLGYIGFLFLYGAGLIGFIYGLSNPGLYGIHIQLAELAYKIIMPFLIILLTIPLCVSKATLQNQNILNPK